MMYFALEFSNQGCAPLTGAKPIPLGEFNSASEALNAACAALNAKPRNHFIIQRSKQRWCVFNCIELSMFI